MLLEKYKGKIIVGCSGGADSMCLAHITISQAKLLGRLDDITLMYVDHNLREESKAEAELVRMFARNQGVTSVVIPVHLTGSLSTEEEARNLRYEAFSKASKALEASWVFLAHTKSDQAETLIMRLLRGTGVRGLVGIPKERGMYVRPIIEVDRDYTEKYCNDNGIWYVEDEMNRDFSYTRCRIRHKWLPMLREENPNLNDALERLSENAKEIRSYMDNQAWELIIQCMDSKKRFHIDQRLMSNDKAIVKHALLLATKLMTGVGIELYHLNKLYDFVWAQSDGQKTLELPGMKIRRTYDYLEWNPKKPEVISVEPPEGMMFRRPEKTDFITYNGRKRNVPRLLKTLKVPKDEREVASVLQDFEGNIVWVEHVGYIK